MAGKWRDPALLRVILKNGCEFTIEGRARFAWDDDGLITDYEIDSPDVFLLPPISEVVAIVRVKRPEVNDG